MGLALSAAVFPAFGIWHDDSGTTPSFRVREKDDESCQSKNYDVNGLWVPIPSYMHFVIEFSEKYVHALTVDLYIRAIYRTSEYLKPCASYAYLCYVSIIHMKHENTYMIHTFTYT